MTDILTDEYALDMVNTFIKHITTSNTQKVELTTKVLSTFTPPQEYNQELWKEFLHKKWDYKLKIFRKAGNYPFKNLPIVRLKDLTVESLNKPIELEECSVSTIAPNRPIQLEHTYICTDCYDDSKDSITGVHHTRNKPKKCKDCDSPDYLIEDFREQDMVDAQWIRVQEINRDLNNSKLPLAIPVRMTGKDMIWKVGFNDHVKLQGLLRYVQVKTKMGGTELIPWFEVFAYEVTCGMDEDITLTDIDRERFRTEMAKPGYWDKVIKSFCPWIYGQEVMKEVVLLGIGSMKTDMPLRILIIGDPSTGKSDVLKAGNMLPAQKHYVIMKNSRGTGLTVTAVKDPDTDQWTVEGGAFVWAHLWTMIIDEFQAGRQEDLEGLNSVIWDHKIPFNLAGVRGEFPASCVLIIACNPQTGVMAKEENIHQLLKFMGEKALSAFISRMSFILFLEEENGKDFHQKVGEHIYDNWSDEQKKKKFWEDWTEDIVVPTAVKGLTIIDKEERFGIKTLQKIVKYITEEVILQDPPKDLRKKFVDYYVKKRMDVTERANKIVTPRYMVHLLGIAQNMGRWHGRGTPNEQDMEYAFELMFHHMTLAATDFKTGELDAGMTNGNIPERQMVEIELEQLSEKGKERQWEWACEKAMAEHEDGWFIREELEKYLKMIPRAIWKHSLQEISKHIHKYEGTGALISSGGKYRWEPSKALI